MLGLTRRSAWAYVIVLGIPGLIAFGMALPAVVQHWTFRRWTATPATVVEKKVTQNEPKGHPDAKLTYVYDFIYEYTAGGHTYDTHWLASGRAEGPQRMPPGQTWEVGESVTVYYNPDDPSHSVVNPNRASLTTHLVLAAGAAFVLGPLGFALLRRAY